MRRGRARARSWLWVLWLGVALVLVAGLPGIVLAVVVLLWRLWRQPPRIGALVVTPQDLQRLLWLDQQRVVLGRPYRVIYRDELRPADFCRLRRCALGLPE